MASTKPAGPGKGEGSHVAPFGPHRQQGKPVHSEDEVSDDGESAADISVDADADKEKEGAEDAPASTAKGSEGLRGSIGSQVAAADDTASALDLSHLSLGPQYTGNTALGSSEAIAAPAAEQPPPDSAAVAAAKRVVLVLDLEAVWANGDAGKNDPTRQYHYIYEIGVRDLGGTFNVSHFVKPALEDGESQDMKLNGYPTTKRGQRVRDLVMGAQPFKLVWDAILATIDAKFGRAASIVVVAHYGEKHDFPILARECERAALQLREWKYCDSWKIAKVLDPDRRAALPAQPGKERTPYALADYTASLLDGNDQEDAAHTVKGDTEALVRLIMFLFGRFHTPGKPMNWSSFLDLGIVSKPSALSYAPRDEPFAAATVPSTPATPALVPGPLPSRPVPKSRSADSLRLDVTPQRPVSSSNSATSGSASGSRRGSGTATPTKGVYPDGQPRDNCLYCTGEVTSRRSKFPNGTDWYACNKCNTRYSGRPRSSQR